MPTWRTCAMAASFGPKVACSRSRTMSALKVRDRKAAIWARVLVLPGQNAPGPQPEVTRLAGELLDPGGEWRVRRNVGEEKSRRGRRPVRGPVLGAHQEDGHLAARHGLVRAVVLRRRSPS